MSSSPLAKQGQQAKDAARLLAHAASITKNNALQLMSKGLQQQRKEILSANAKDVLEATQNGLAANQIDRLTLTEARIEQICESLHLIEALEDPVGRQIEKTTRPNGLIIEKHSVPLGVIGIIFESRPNVAVDAAALCLKSGNACILRGGSESWHTMEALGQVFEKALAESGLPLYAIQILPSTDRALVTALLQLDEYVDVIIPRGGKSLINLVRKESRIPVLSQLEGICHTYIDVKADSKKAVAITLNAKMRRTSICGATECLILHEQIVSTIGKDVLHALLDKGCEVRVPEALMTQDSRFILAEESDYGFEFQGPVLAVAVVPDLETAIDFITLHHSQHTDAIITEDGKAASYFLSHVPSAICMHNTSTQFADGYEFGKGAEIGIATGKLHARGPVGLPELTTYQYRVLGKGQVRP